MTFVLEIAMLTTISYILIAWICIIIVIFCFRRFLSYILYPFSIFIKHNVITYYLPRFYCYKRYQIIFVFFSLHNCRVYPFLLLFSIICCIFSSIPFTYLFIQSTNVVFHISIISILFFLRITSKYKQKIKYFIMYICY